MSDKKTISMEMRLNAARAALRAASQQIEHYADAPRELKALRLQLLLALDMLETALGEKRAQLNQADLTRVSRGVSAAYQKYLTAYGQLGRGQKEAQAPILNLVKTAVGGFVLPEVGAAEQISHLLSMGREERRTYHEDLGDSLLRTLPQGAPMAIHAPGLQNIMTLDIATSNPERVFYTLMWLGMNEARVRHHNLAAPEVLENNPFHKQYVRLMRDLNNAPVDVQLRYARLFNRQSILNQDRVALELESIRAAQAEGAEQELQRRDSFRHAQSFRMMCDDLRGPMAFLIRQSSEPSGSALERTMDTIADRRREVNTLLAADSEETRRRALDEASISYLNTRLPAAAYGLLNRMNEDQETQSDTCRAMYKMMYLFSREDHGDIPNEDRYLKRLTACERAARLYLKTHRPVPHTDEGKKRIALANDILQFCENARNELDAKIQGRNRDAIEALKNKRGRTFEDLAQLARLQKVGATAAINPMVRDFDPPKSWLSRTWGHLRHGLVTIATAVAQVSVGLIGNLPGIVGAAYVYGIKTPFYLLRHGTPKPLDLVTAPGERDAALREAIHDKVDEKTGILTDVRRVPMTWERELPDDPNQPPTVSFRVEQPKPGTSVGETKEDMGHGFICLKYSKVNPATGKLQRYETSFGFYPKGGVSMSLAQAAMFQTGFQAPGELRDDCDHSYSVERTVRANAAQINHLLRLAHRYERDGYNFFSRNCTTLLVDAANSIGVNLNFQEVDLTTERISTKLAATFAPLVGNVAAYTVADNAVLNYANRDDFSFQRYGQKMVSKEEYERSNGIFLNQRLRGYAPGAAGQTIRADARFSIHNHEDTLLKPAVAATKDEIRQAFEENNQEKLKELNIGRYKDQGGLARLTEREPLRLELLVLRNTVLQLHADMATKLEGRVADQETLNKARQDFMDYNQTVIDALTVAAKQMELSRNPPSSIAADASRLLGEYVESLDRFYRVNFRSDAALTDGFQRVASVANDLQRGINMQYRTSIRREQSEKILETAPEKLRDTALIVRDFLSGSAGEMKLLDRNTVPEVRISMQNMLAIGRVYKTLDEFNRDIQVQGEGEDDDATSEQKSAAKKAKIRDDLRQDFETVYKNFPFQESYSNSDLNLVFNTLPAGQNYAATAEFDDRARWLQCLPLEHVFGGLMSQLGPDIRGDIRKLSDFPETEREMVEVEAKRDACCKKQEGLKENSPEWKALEQERKAFNHRFEELDNQRTDQFIDNAYKYLDRTFENLAMGINEKLGSLTPEEKTYLRTIQVCIAQRLYAKDLKTNPDLAPDNKNYAELAFKELTDTLANTYCARLVEGAMDSASIGMDCKIPNQYCDLDTTKIQNAIRIPRAFLAPITGLNRKSPNPTLAAPANPRPQAPAPMQK